MDDYFEKLVDTTSPPHNREAEQAVIGPMIRFEQTFDEISEFVSEDDFYFDCHRKLFRLVREMRGKDERVDFAIVGYRLRDLNMLEDVGGAKYLIELFEVDHTGANAVYFAKAVRSTAERRRVLMCCQLAVKQIYDNKPIDEVVGELEDGLNRSKAESERLRVCPFATIVEEEFKRITDARAGLLDDPGIMTGLQMIDEAMGGIRPGVTVVGARTSVGKTAFGLQLMLAAGKANVPTLMISLEMNPFELLQRQVSVLGQVDLRTLIVSPNILTDNEVSRIHHSLKTIEGMPLYFLDCDFLNPSQFQMAVRRAIHKYGVRMVILDYVQLMEGDNKKASKLEQVTETTRVLKSFQKRYGIAIIELAQLNRNSLNNDEPKLSDFRDCGSIEQDADNAILLWKTGEESDLTLTIGCHIAKQRNGPLPKFNLIFRKRLATFENYGVDY